MDEWKRQKSIVALAIRYVNESGKRVITWYYALRGQDTGVVPIAWSDFMLNSPL